MTTQDPFGRVGQVWEIYGSVELIIKWHKNGRYLTYVLDNNTEANFNRFDQVSELALANAVNHVSYVRIA